MVSVNSLPARSAQHVPIYVHFGVYYMYFFSLRHTLLFKVIRCVSFSVHSVIIIIFINLIFVLYPFITWSIVNKDKIQYSDNPFSRCLIYVNEYVYTCIHQVPYTV